MAVTTSDGVTPAILAHVAIASFHLVEVARRAAPAGIARIGLDRKPLGSVAGLRAAHLLGTGRDGKMAHSFQPTRRALFAVWDDDVALDRFLADHPIAERWRSAAETWHVRLRLVSGHGRWGGVHVLDEVDRAGPHEGPVVTLTRAAIAPRSVVPFTRAARRVSRTISDAPGLRVVVGVGDVPIVRLGTVAVWDDDRAATSASSAWAEHADAMRAAQEGGWFTESLFARFVPYGSEGTWSGRDPVV